MALVASALDRRFHQVVTNLCKGRLPCPEINSGSSKMAKITYICTRRVSRVWELAAQSPKLNSKQPCARISSLCSFSWCWTSEQWQYISQWYVPFSEAVVSVWFQFYYIWIFSKYECKNILNLFRKHPGWVNIWWCCQIHIKYMHWKEIFSVLVFLWGPGHGFYSCMPLFRHLSLYCSCNKYLIFQSLAIKHALWNM